MDNETLFKPGDQKAAVPQGDFSSGARRFDIAWMVLLFIFTSTGVAAICFGWRLPGALMVIAGMPGGGAILRGIIAERLMIKRMRKRAAPKAE